jgi:hypothetical protein
MPRRRALLASALVIIPLAASCSGEHATKEFATDVTGERLFEAYGKTGSFTTIVRPSSAASEFVLSMDCVNSTGSIQVRLTGDSPPYDGMGDIPCGEKAQPNGPNGAITLSTNDRGGFPREVKVTITVSEGAEWSAAVDTRSNE